MAGGLVVVRMASLIVWAIVEADWMKMYTDCTRRLEPPSRFIACLGFFLYQSLSGAIRYATFDKNRF